MFRRIAVTSLFALIVTIAGLSFNSLKAEAATGNGATIIDSYNCLIFSDFQACLQLNGVFNTTTTTSGISVLVNNMRFTSTILDVNGNVIWTSHGSTMFQVISKDGVEFESGNHVTQYFNSGALNCTLSFDLHYANGAIQYDNENLVCR